MGASTSGHDSCEPSLEELLLGGYHLEADFYQCINNGRSQNCNRRTATSDDLGYILKSVSTQDRYGYVVQAQVPSARW